MKNALNPDPHLDNLPTRVAKAEASYLALLEKCRKYETLLRMAPPKQSVTDQRYWKWYALVVKVLEEMK